MDHPVFCLDDFPLPVVVSGANSGLILVQNYLAINLFGDLSCSETKKISDLVIDRNNILCGKGFGNQFADMGVFSCNTHHGITLSMRIRTKKSTYKDAPCFIFTFESQQDSEFSSTSGHSKQLNTSKFNKDVDLSNLRALEEFQNAIYGSSIISRTDKKGNITFVNDNFIRISGYTQEELLGKNHRLINSGFHKKSFWVEMWRTIIQGKPWRAEVKNMAKDGSFYWVDTFIFPIVDEKGGLREILSIRNDITSLKLFESELESTKEQLYTSNLQNRSSDSKIQMLLNGITDGLFALDTELNFTLVNPIFASLAEMSPSEMIGKNILSLFPYMKGGELYSTYKKVLKTGRSAIIEHYNPLHAEQVFEINIYPNDQGLLVYYKDISEQKKAMVELEQSHLTLQTIMDNTPQVMFMKDLDGRYIYFNETFKKIIDHKELINGLTDYDIFDKDFSDTCRQLDNYVLQTQAPYTFEHKVGDMTFMETKFPIKNSEGKMVALGGVSQDITSLKKTSEKLETANRLFQRLSTNVPGMIYNFYLDDNHAGVFEFVSEGCIQLLGVTANSLIQDASILFKMIHSDDYSRVMNSIFGAVKENEPWKQEFRIIMSDGSEKWIFGESSPFIENDGKNLWYGFMSDMTEYKKAEFKIIESESKYKLLADNTMDLICLQDIEGRFSYVSPSVINILGYTPEELIGMDSFNIFHPEDQAFIVAHGLSENMKGKQVKDLPYRIKNKCGEFLWFETSSTPLYDSTGSIINLQTTSRDISKRRLAEEGLRESQAKMESFFQSTTESILLISRDFRILDYNKKAQDYTRLMFGEELWNGRSMLDFTTPQNTEAFQKNILNAFNGNGLELEREIQEISGRWKWWKFQYVPVSNSDGDIISVAFISRDIDTEKKSLNRLVNLTNGIPDVMIFEFLLSEDHGYCEFTYVSDGCKNLLELPNNALTTNPEILRELIYEDDKEIFLSEFLGGKSHLQKTDLDCRIVTPHGKLKWVKIKSTIKILEDRSYLIEGICMDISRQKYLEQEEAANRFRLQGILDNMINGVIVLSEEGIITFVNEGACRILEVKESSLVNVSFNDIPWKVCGLDGRMLNKSELPLNVALQDQKLVGDLTLGYYTSPKKLRWLSVNAAPFIDGNGRVCGAVASFVDTTDSREMMNRLEHSEGELRAIIDASADTTIFINAKHQVQNYNRAAAEQIHKLYGLTLEKGRYIGEVVPAEAISTIENNLKRAFKGEQVMSERDLKGKNGEIYHARFRYLPVTNSNGLIIGVSFTATDITSHKNIETKLLQAADHMRFAAQLASIGSWELNLSNHTFHFSEEVCHIFGVDPGCSPTHEEFNSFYRGEYQALVQQAINLCISKGKSIDIEAEINHKDGDIHWIRMIGLAISAEKNSMIFGLIQDISEAKRNEQELSRLALIAKNTNNLVVITNKDRQIQWVNEAFLKITEFSEEEVIGRTPAMLVQGNDTDVETKKYIKARLDNEQPVKCEILNYSKSGRKYWLNMEIQPVFNKRGILDYFIAIETDITHRKMAENILRASENRFKLAAKTANLGVFEYDFEIPKLYFDPVARQIFGIMNLPENEIIPYWYARLHPDDVLRVDTLLQSGIQHRTPISMNYRWLKDTGEEIIVHVNATFQINRQGRSVLVSGILSDITEQQKSEDKLKESEIRFRSMADNAPVLIWLATEDGMRFYFNKVYLDFTGRSLDQEMDMKWTDKIHPDDLIEVSKTYLNSLKHRKSFRIEYRMERFDGEYRWILSTGDPRYLNDGSFVGYVGTGVDITEMKEAEVALLSSNHEKDLLIKEIHHRVKNNLQLISSILYLKMEAVEPPEIKEFLLGTMQKVRSVALVHERLLQTNSVNQVMISDYLGKMIKDLQMTTNKPDLSVSVITHFDDIIMGLDCTIYCGFIINELYMNAIKHAFENVENAEIEISFVKRDAYYLTVRNNGNPIPEHISIGENQSFGMHLLHILIKQLKGEFHLDRQNGTSVSIRFH